MKKIDWFEQKFHQWCQNHPGGVSARDMAVAFNLDRSTVSRYLNQLVAKGTARKIVGRPVRYVPAGKKLAKMAQANFLEDADAPLDPIPVTPWMEEALAALLYPPNGLPILLTGETGVGKSYLAKRLVEISIERGHLPADTPFISFNCAEYAQNPELLLGQLFGVKKGAYTGAEKEKTGLVERADKGILFLDEIHRLPPSGQEMLFTLMDQGTYRRLGETTLERQAKVRLIGATTEDPREALLPTLGRRFSVKVEIPPLAKRSQREREQLLQLFLHEEAQQMKLPLSITEECRQRFLSYECPGNIGQFKSDFQIACARAFLRNMYTLENEVVIQLHDLPAHLRHVPQSKAAPAIKRPGDSLSPPANETAKKANIYDRLRQRKEWLLQQNTEVSELNQQLLDTVNEYIQQLIKAAKNRIQQTPTYARNYLFERLRSLAEETEADIPDTRLEALAFHLQSVLDSSSSRSKPPLPVSWAESGAARYAPLIRKIADMVENDWNLSLPEEELALMGLFFSYEDPVPAKKRLILTVCLTGEGAAVSLEMWLKEQLPAAYRDVEIRPLQIDPLTRQSPRLSHWKESYHLIAIVGTVPPVTDEVPYIPIWELYQPHGFERLLQLLEQSQPHEPAQTEILFERIPEWIEQGLRESVTHYNPKRFVRVLDEFAPRFRSHFQWDAEREIGLWMHLGIYTDQILRQEREKKSGQPLEPPASPEELPAADIRLWEELLSRLSDTFFVVYPPQTSQEMARLSVTR